MERRCVPFEAASLLDELLKSEGSLNSMRGFDMFGHGCAVPQMDCLQDILHVLQPAAFTSTILILPLSSVDAVVVH